MREIQLRLGRVNVAPLQISQLLIRPERVLKGTLSAPALWPAALGLRAWSALRDRGRGQARAEATIREVGTFDRRHDALWHPVSSGMMCGVVRDASYMNWKYVEQPGQTFIRLELVDDGAVLASAVLVLREPEAAYAYRRAFLVDLVAPLSDEEVLDALLPGVHATAGRHNADTLLCVHISEPLTCALKRAGFQRRTPQRFLLVDPAGLPHHLRELVPDTGNWYVTQGDSDIDRPGR